MTRAGAPGEVSQQPSFKSGGSWSLWRHLCTLAVLPSDFLERDPRHNSARLSHFSAVNFFFFRFLRFSSDSCRYQLLSALIFFCLAGLKYFCSRRPIAKVVFSASPGKKIVYAPREKIKNASDRMFVTLAFGSGDNLHTIWDILYFCSLEP